MSLENCLEVSSPREHENIPDQQGCSDVGQAEERVGAGEGLSCSDLPGGRGRNPSSGSCVRWRDEGAQGGGLRWKDEGAQGGGLRWKDEGAQGGGLRWEMGATESCLLLHQGPSDSLQPPREDCSPDLPPPSVASCPKSIMRTRTATFSHPCHWEPLKVSMSEHVEMIPKQRTRHQTYSEESQRKRNAPELTLDLPPPQPEFSFLDLQPDISTAPVKLDTSGDSRRTFSFGGGLGRGRPSASSRNRMMTLSGDSSFSSPDTQLDMGRVLSRAISRTYTMTSMAEGSTSTIMVEEWQPIFDRFDLESDGKMDGKIPLEKFAAILEGDPVWKESVPQSLKQKIIQEVDLNKDGVIDYSEFLTLVKGRHLGLGTRRRRAFRQLLKETVEFLVPYKYTYQNQYSCSPPRLFMLLVSLVQASIFLFNSYQQIGNIGLHGPVPYCSHLIYSPARPDQVWRYLTYSLVHSGLFHVSFNILVQLVLGVPLEMVHGGLRVAAVYLSGILAGSLWTSILKPGVFLSGASGGVYALITGHLATLIMNHREMSYPWWRLAVVSLTALTDAGVYVYEAVLGRAAKPVSYPAHIAGAVAGLLVGLVCLRNLSWEPHQRYIWLACLVTYALLILVSCGWVFLKPGPPGLSPHLLQLTGNCSAFLL